jgi:hypothetical protein
LAGAFLSHFIPSAGNVVGTVSSPDDLSNSTRPEF